jgi:hypothetical protein
LQANNNALVVGAGFANASDIVAALDAQKRTYEALSTMPEPNRQNIPQQITDVHKKLGNLITKFGDLGNVDRKIRKFLKMK